MYYTKKQLYVYEGVVHQKSCLLYIQIYFKTVFLHQCIYVCVGKTQIVKLVCYKFLQASKGNKMA